jgi:DNA repair protein RadC
LFAQGAAALSDSELLGLLIGSGCGRENAVETARRILGEVGGLDALSQTGIGGLKNIRGIGDAKAARLNAAFELGLRAEEERAKGKHPVAFSCSKDIFEAFRARLGMLRQEIFLAVGLNNRNEIIREITVAMGTVSECRVEPREVFRPLIAEAAARAVLVHNHPSGDPTPSAADIAVTARLADAGKLVGIPILDHIVISRFGYSSLADLNLLTGG